MTDDRPACFVAMPLTTAGDALPLYRDDADHFVHVLDHLFVPAIEQAGYRAIRPIVSGADLIHAEIIRNLEQADLVVCDISRHNPNVFFELGIRTALDRPVALVRDSKTDKLPFDTGILNTYTYECSLAPWLLAGEIDNLASHVKTSADRSGGTNALWRYFGLTRRGEGAPEAEDPIEAKLDLLLGEVAAMKTGSSAPSGGMVTFRAAESDGRIVISKTTLAAANDDAGTRRMLNDLGDFTRRFGLNILVTELGDRVLGIASESQLTNDQRALLEALADTAGYSVVVRKVA